MSSAPTAATDSLSRSVNVAARLTEMAQRMPEAVAVACPGRGDVVGRHSYATCTFGELDHDATALACGFAEIGVTPTARLVLLVPPSVEFVKLVFALLRCGATTVLIDPGMGRRHLMRCLQEVEPEGFVAISAAQAVRSVLRKRFPRATKNVTVGRRWFWGGPTYQRLLALGRRSQAQLPATRGDDPAAIIFTSGSTGPPKGVLYTHRMFLTQADEIRRQYAIPPGGADLACFALFGLFNSALGVTTVFPRMDFSRPASADPRQLLAAAHDWRVTQAFASPAVWRKLGVYCATHEERIPTLRKIFSCGAPVPAGVLRETLACVHPTAEMHTPYGATESLPVATISAAEVLRETAGETDRGRGVCVGRKFDSIAWSVIRITDEPIASWQEVEELPAGEIGELVVRGPQVSPAYVTGGDQHHALAKIQDGETVWHRTGDVGRFDDQGRFWYCGRKAHRFVTSSGTLFSVPCEAVFETHPDVSRAAVVGIGAAPDQTPVAIIQPQAWAPTQQRRLSTELLELASRHQVTKPITRLVFRRSLPVDVRHNSKINREQLAAWAGTKCAQALQPPASSLQPPASLMHTLVTGGGGFLGRYIVEQLVARGDRVRSFGRGEYPELAALGVEVVRGDIRDRDAVAEACRDTQCVIHAAAIAGIGGPWRRFYETNVLGTENVLAACRAHGVQRLVFTGSPSAVFAGKDQCGIDESAPYSLEWLQRHAAHYSRSKALAEQMVLSTNESGRLATCAVRPHLVWGPRDVHLIPRLLARARRGRLRRVGDGTNLVDITFVENAAAAHLAAADSLAEASSPAAGRAYFISQGEPVNCWQWIDDVLQLAELPPVARSLSFRAAWGIGAGCEAAYRLAGGQREPPMTRFLSAQLARSHWFDICAARRDLGYEPRISTAEGMRRLGDWLRQPA